ncbi:MAG TPA: anti-sigma factor [Sphingomicrobium sp.]|nr:anti-sigma factor [Sphingomicrobium sp.]
MTEEEKFFAWLDGELAPAEAVEMAAKVAADPRLSLLAEQHRNLGDELRGAFGPIAQEPVPENLQRALRSSGNVIPFLPSRTRIMPGAVQWAALAATLVVGVFVGAMVPRPANAPIELRGGRMYAAAALAGALDTQLASAPKGDVRIGITFRDRAGEYCRSFTAAASSGLACRTGGHWQLKGMFGAPEGNANEYRMAAGMDPNLASLVDASIAGEPLDAAGERAARDRGWR